MLLWIQCAAKVCDHFVRFDFVIKISGSRCWVTQKQNTGLRNSLCILRFQLIVPVSRLEVTGFLLREKAVHVYEHIALTSCYDLLAPPNKAFLCHKWLPHVHICTVHLCGNPRRADSNAMMCSCGCVGG